MSQPVFHQAHPLKIGVMLRGMDGKGGIGIYCQNLMDHLLEIDDFNSYVLYYANEGFLGRYKSFPNVEECYVKAPGKFLWDQLLVPRQAHRDGVDVLFNTKFTVPLFAKCKTAMAVHGAGWWLTPQMYKWLDIAYVRASQPLYCRKADAILSNSQCTTDDYIRILHLPPKKVRTVRLAADDSFKPCDNPAELEATRRQYSLPERFILSVVKYDPRKNVPNLLEAFRLCRQKIECKIVVIGSGCETFREECRLQEKGIADDVTFLGWVDNKQLPSLYNLADFLFFPSVYEEFGIPTVEAMSCGTPVVVSQTGALPELAGEAGILVDPEDPVNMAEVLYQMWTDDGLRHIMAKQAFERSKLFGWDKCAQHTLNILREIGCKAQSNGRLGLWPSLTGSQRPRHFSQKTIPGNNNMQTDSLPSQNRH